MTDGPRFTGFDMRPRDWRLLASMLPRLDDCDCDPLRLDLRWLAEGGGWHTRDGHLVEIGRKYHRRVWRGLSAGPCQEGPFRAERSGRWGIVFVLDPAYAEQRKVRRRRRCQSAAIDHTGRGRGDWDATFQRLHEAETERCFEVGRQRAVIDPDSAEWEYLHDGDTPVSQAAESRPEPAAESTVPPIQQSELAELASLFDSTVARLRDLAERSDPDIGGSVERGPLSLDTPVLPEDVDILEDQFRAFITSWWPFGKRGVAVDGSGLTKEYRL